MGFLMGAYGKLMAGKRMRSIQYQLTTVQSRLRRVTREIGDKEKDYAAQERNMKQMSQMQMQNAMAGRLALWAQDTSNPDMARMAQIWGAGMFGGNMFGGDAFEGIDSRAQTSFMTAYSAMQQSIQMQYAASQKLWQDTFEMQKEADLQALKDLEEELQIEKDNLESQLKIAQADYEANKEMEKQGAQNLKPDYTGQA